MAPTFGVSGVGSIGTTRRTCPTCSTQFEVNHPQQRFCSKPCRTRKVGRKPPTEAERARLRAKAQARGQHHPKIFYTRLRPQVLERDRWQCRMPVCKQPNRTIPRAGLRAWHPRSASVDLIVPKSLGGSDLDLDNLRAAHFGCNSSRGNGTRKPRSVPARSREW